MHFKWWRNNSSRVGRPTIKNFLSPKKWVSSVQLKTVSHRFFVWLLLVLLFLWLFFVCLFFFLLFQWFEEITQQFSIYNTCFGKLIPSSVVEACYNLNFFRCGSWLQFEYANYNDFNKSWMWQKNNEEREMLFLFLLFWRWHKFAETCLVNWKLLCYFFKQPIFCSRVRLLFLFMFLFLFFLFFG